MQAGDTVKLHAHGVTIFEITELDDTHAHLTPTLTTAAGAYPFRILRAGLVPAKTEEH